MYTRRNRNIRVHVQSKKKQVSHTGEVRCADKALMKSATGHPNHLYTHKKQHNNTTQTTTQQHTFTLHANHIMIRVSCRTDMRFTSTLAFTSHNANHIHIPMQDSSSSFSSVSVALARSPYPFNACICSCFCVLP